MEEVNEVIDLSKKILHFFYITMIIATVFIVTLIAREWGVWNFILNILNVLSPFFIGFVLAWILNPIVNKLEKKKMPRVVGSMLVYAIMILSLALFVGYMLPVIYDQIQVLIRNLPSIFNEVEIFMNNIVSRLGNIDGVDFVSIKNQIFTTITGSFNNFMTSLPNTIMSMVGNLFSSLVTICFGLVIGLYMLIDFDSINGHLLNLLPKKNRFEASLLKV